MKVSAWIALLLGLVIAFALIVHQGIGLVTASFLTAGWSIVGIAFFHLLPLVLDSAAISVLIRNWRIRASMLGRWIGESVNSLLPAAQVGGAVIMARIIGMRGVKEAEAGAAITVCMTQQIFAQGAFTIMGLLLLSTHTHDWHILLPLSAAALFCLVGVGVVFYAQRRGLFVRLALWSGKLFRRKPKLGTLRHAHRLDIAIGLLYRKPREVTISFSLSLIAWVAGTGEVWLALRALRHPVSISDAFIIESLGQSIRALAFFIPGGFGAQEGGYELLCGLFGIPSAVGLSLSLIKRAREVILGVPGIVYWQIIEGLRLRRRPALA